MISPTLGKQIAFVLGAGASIPPLVSQQQLVLQLLEASASPRILPAQTYLRRAFPGLRQDMVLGGAFRFEDVVGPLEIAESEEYWYHFAGHTRGRRKSILIPNKEVLDSLDAWVALALDPEVLPKPLSTADTAGHRVRADYTNYYVPSERAPLPYAKLVSLLGELNILEQTAFVSMNYDVLLDRVLLASGKHLPDYSIDAFLEEGEESKGPELPSRLPVILLKLHGSLNWRVCETCHVLRNLKERLAWPKDRCVDCDRDTARPMLIRPTLLKDFRHRVWRDVWRQAGHVLAQARKWVFVGYSLPLADVWMLRLLVQSARSAGIRAEDRNVIVVDIDPSVRDRFSLLFPRLTFHGRGFEDWIDECRKNGQLR
jgi:hypothetical protein